MLFINVLLVYCSVTKNKVHEGNLPSLAITADLLRAVVSGVVRGMVRVHA